MTLDHRIVLCMSTEDEYAILGAPVGEPRPQSPAGRARLGDTGIQITVTRPVIKGHVSWIGDRLVEPPPVAAMA